MNQADFEALLADQTKVIVGDIRWADDEDHSPSVEFRAEVDSESGHPIFIRGSYNALAQTLTYALIHRGSGRIYALDLGKDHHNPDCQNVGERHKHRWRDPVRDKEAYVPFDLDAAVNNPLQVWRQFCAEASIHHHGEMHPPPATFRFP
ncbi:MAG TPA: hypothetical protein VN956_15740 [Pyrinomonadaceae bacterium]|nr:hypothetical protein [Pyrinomonadaceae bacterium]